MDTSALKEFAAETRRELTQGVSARLDTVLLPGSAARLDFPVLVGKLERAIEQTSREAVVDRVTYLWFNRFVALRFMDACGYTPVGVVSPAEGVDPMQAPPQVVSDAFAGIIDTDIVGTEVAQQVSDVVSGVRRSQDQYSDVFALLLDAYAQHFKSWVPAMFPDADDISNLLLPASLLSADSVVRKVAQTMTPEMCQNVEVIGWLYQFYIAERKDEVFEGFKKGVKAGAEQIPAATQLFTPDWIVRYLVQNTVGRTWLLNRPGSALRQQMEYFVEPVGGLESVEDFVRITSPEELTVLDPAVGSGHMLTYAFDLLYEMYLEDGYAEADIPGLILSKNLVGLELDERAGALASFALTMKARGRYRRFFRRAVQPSICVLKPVAFLGEELRELARGFDFTRDYAGADSAQPIMVDEARFDQFWNAFEHADVFGSLIRPDAEVLELMEKHWAQHNLAQETTEDTLDVQTEQSLTTKVEAVLRQARLLSQKYVTVVANPPYMGSSSMGNELTDFAKSNFPNTKFDLCTMFIERGVELSKTHSAVGMVTMQSWMFLKSFGNFRKNFVEDAPISSMFHIGTRGFDSIGGEVVGTTAFVMTPQADCTQPGQFIRLADVKGEAAKSQLALDILQGKNDKRYILKTADFFKVPDRAIIYWLSKEIINRFGGDRIGDKYYSGGRLKTHGNGKYIRFWWEVNSDTCRWVKTANGGSFSPYSEKIASVVDYSDEAYAFYESKGGLPKPGAKDKQGITWNLITSKRTSFRLNEIGELFTSASPTIFKINGQDDHVPYLAYLNTQLVADILSAVNPTLNTVVDNVLSLPDLSDSSLKAIKLPGLEIKEILDSVNSKSETNIHFSKFYDLNYSQLTECVENNIRKIDDKIRKAIYQCDYIETVVREDFGLEATLDKSSEIGISNIESENEFVKDLISYFVGVLFGRYSLDAPGLILANQGETLTDYLAKAGTEAPTFIPDEDNVIPVLADDRFEDDIVAKFKAFLKKAFGEENLEANLAFIEDSLGKNIRKYFTDDFFKDHLKRYSNRPIYWMFSSTGNGRGSFKALIYMHRYTPATASTVLNDYLRPYMDKLTANREHLQYTITHGEGIEVTKAQKEDDKLDRVLKELTDYQDDVLYPLALQNQHIDLDDGVAHNYQLLGKALISFR